MNKKQGVDLKLDVYKLFQDKQTSSILSACLLPLKSSKYSKQQESSITRDLRDLARYDAVNSTQDKIEDLRFCIKTSLNKLNLKERTKLTPTRSTPVHYDTSRSTSVENSIRNRKFDHNQGTLAIKVQDLQLENQLLHEVIHKRDEKISNLEEQVYNLASTIQNHQDIL